MIDNASDAQGFQLGLLHDGAILTPSAISQAGVLQASNGGAGADYYFFELAPIGGPGVVVGTIVSLSPPLETIPAGTGNLVTDISYTIAPTALPGSSSALTLTDTLGSPPVALVVSVDGVSQAPALLHGSVQVDTPPVSGLTCGVIDPCTCEASLSWTNGFAYDAVEITRNGVLIASLPGTATSHTLSLPAGAQDLCVTGIANLSPSAPTCCTLDCTPLPTGLAPSGLVCTIDHATCDVTLAWTNNEANYSGIEILLDGVSALTLPGSATSAVVTLPATDVIFTFEVIATDFCGLVLPGLSCIQECLPERFVRGDVNGDGNVDITDPIAGLSYVFAGAPAACLDALDPNDSGAIDISDMIYMLTYIFAAGQTPAAPFPACGVDPSDTDPLDCATYLCP